MRLLGLQPEIHAIVLSNVKDKANIRGCCVAMRDAVYAGTTSLTALHDLSTIPPSALSTSLFLKCTRLQSLDCRIAGLTDIGPLASLTGLTSLDCSFTSVADIGCLTALTRLTELRISHTPVVDFVPLSSLTGLRVLDCGTTSLADIGPLAALTDLRFR